MLEVPFIPCCQLFKRLLISFGRIFTWSDCVQSKPKFISAHPKSIINNSNRNSTHRQRNIYLDLIILRGNYFIERIFVDQPENDSDPCFVRNSVMWTTTSADRMKWSHFVTHHLYQLAPFKAHCISGKRIYDDPADAADFPFAFAQQN